MNTFEGIQHIGEKIFNYLTTQDLLNCRLTSKSWKHILDNPIFWLKKLNTFGEYHTVEIHNKWLTLIKLAKQNEVPISKITYCLIIKYCKFIIHPREIWSSRIQKIKPSDSEWIEIQKFILGLPPIYQALHTKFPDIEVIKLVGESDETFIDTIECPRHYKLYYARFILPHRSEKKYLTNPLHESIKLGHDLEVLRYLMSKTENPMQALTEGTPIDLAVKRDNLKLYKFFSEMVPKQDFNQEINYAVKCGSVEIIKYLVSQTENPTLTYRKILIKQKPIYLAIRYNNLKLCQLFTEMSLIEVDKIIFNNEYTAFELAILMKRVEILKYLVSKSKEPNKTLGKFSITPLHRLAWFSISCQKYTKCPCVEMLEIIVPKITNFDVQEQSSNETALHLVLSQYEFRKPNKCLEQKIRMLAPLTSLNLPDESGQTALGYARSDEDIYRIFSELNLLNH